MGGFGEGGGEEEAADEEVKEEGEPETVVAQRGEGEDV